MNSCLVCTSITSFILMIIFGVISIGCYYGGVVHDGLINQELYPTQGLIISARNVYDPQTYCCVSTSNGCDVYCQRSEWDHYLTFQYMVNTTIAQDGGQFETELYMWTDFSPVITQTGYQIGDYLGVFYFLCAFTPTFHQDIIIC